MLVELEQSKLRASFLSPHPLPLLNSRLGHDFDLEDKSKGAGERARENVGQVATRLPVTRLRVGWGTQTISP
jgi:hypothetical protein